MIREKIEKMIIRKRNSGDTDFSSIKEQIIIYANTGLLTQDDKDYLMSLAS